MAATSGYSPICNVDDHLAVPDIVDAADFAARWGFDQLWINDNLECRNNFVVLAAIVNSVDIRIGTAVVVPYYRNPVDLTDSIGALTELSPGKEVTIGIGRGSIGIGRGSIGKTDKSVKTPHPYTMLSETVSFVGSLLNGEIVHATEYELLTRYHNLLPDAQFSMRFEPHSRVRFYIGGYGKSALTVGGKSMDGALFGEKFLSFFKAVRSDELFSIITTAAQQSGRQREPSFIAEVNVSISEDQAVAQRSPKPYVAQYLPSLRQSGFSDEDFESAGIEPNAIRSLETAVANDISQEKIESYVTDEMIDAMFIAGDPEVCRTKLTTLLESPTFERLDQLIFTNLGPDYKNSIELLGESVFPALR